VPAYDSKDVYPAHNPSNTEAPVETPRLQHPGILPSPPRAPPGSLFQRFAFAVGRPGSVMEAPTLDLDRPFSEAGSLLRPATSGSFTSPSRSGG
jgi:hypothetical protein